MAVLMRTSLLSAMNRTPAVQLVGTSFVLRGLHDSNLVVKIKILLQIICRLPTIDLLMLKFCVLEVGLSHDIF
jgi:hypothetical protein